MNYPKYLERVTGPCEFLVMYDKFKSFVYVLIVTGPCEFLVMYDFYAIIDKKKTTYILYC